MGNKTSLFDAINTPDFLIYFAAFIGGTVTLAIRKRKDPVNVYIFIGEVVLAGGVALMYWLAGFYHGLDSIQISLLALPAAYGQVSLATKLIRYKRNGTDINPKS